MIFITACISTFQFLCVFVGASGLKTCACVWLRIEEIIMSKILISFEFFTGVKES
jgi:hypothetical protein